MIPRVRLRHKQIQMLLDNLIFMPKARMTEKKREKLGGRLGKYVRR